MAWQSIICCITQKDLCDIYLQNCTFIWIIYLHFIKQPIFESLNFPNIMENDEVGEGAAQYAGQQRPVNREHVQGGQTTQLRHLPGQINR